MSWRLNTEDQAPVSIPSAPCLSISWWPSQRNIQFS